MFAIVRLDAYISVITDQPPQLRYKSITLRLPVSEGLWDAKDDEAFRALQWSEPNGREKLRFNYFIRDYIFSRKFRNSLMPLSESDHHVGLCSVQGEIWETVQEQNYCSCDAGGWKIEDVGDAPGFTSGSATFPWNEYFDSLLTSATPRDSPAVQSSPSNSWLSSLHFTPILCHLSAISLYANARRFQHDGNCMSCSASFNPHTSAPEARNVAWARSSDARRATYSAAALLLLFRQGDSATSDTGMRGIALNPLAATALNRAAEVLFRYSRTTASCSNCTGMATSPMNLLVGDISDPTVQTWIAGGGAASLGGMPVCRCSTSDIAELFTKQMASSEQSFKEGRRV